MASDPPLSAAQSKLLHALVEGPRAKSVLDPALGDSLKAIAEAAKWDFAQAWGADVEERSLVPGACWMRGAEMKPYRDASVSAETKYGIGILWGAYLNRRPVVILDLSKEPTFRRSPGAAKAGLRGGIFVPIPAGNLTVGVIEFLIAAPKPEDAALATFALRAAEAIGRGIQA